MHRYFTHVSVRLRSYLPLQKNRDAQFAKQLCNGDGDAWVQLLDQWSPHLYSYVSFNVVQETDVRRLMRLILSELIQTLVGEQPIANLTVVIFRIAYRHLLRYRRQAPDPFASPLWQRKQAAATGEALPNYFFQHLQRFSPEVQQLLLLRYVCGVTLPELAAIVGQSEDLLTRLLYRTRFYPT
ncbi:MAG: sigma-70 family RNA polymerase sigma factor [Caldilinea sp. CFX5]|nr:sigma-70 family RNA polymerase sigma factor [Caldilinea sp. CFX5]